LRLLCSVGMAFAAMLSQDVPGSLSVGGDTAGLLVLSNDMESVLDSESSPSRLGGTHAWVSACESPDPTSHLGANLASSLNPSADCGEGAYASVGEYCGSASELSTCVASSPGGRCEADDVISPAAASDDLTHHEDQAVAVVKNFLMIREYKAQHPFGHEPGGVEASMLYLHGESRHLVEEAAAVAAQMVEISRMREEVEADRIQLQRRSREELEVAKQELRRGSDEAIEAAKHELHSRSEAAKAELCRQSQLDLDAAKEELRRQREEAELAARERVAQAEVAAQKQAEDIQIAAKQRQAELQKAHEQTKKEVEAAKQGQQLIQAELLKAKEEARRVAESSAHEKELLEAALRHAREQLEETAQLQHGLEEELQCFKV